MSPRLQKIGGPSTVPGGRCRLRGAPRAARPGQRERVPQV